MEKAAFVIILLSLLLISGCSQESTLSAKIVECMADNSTIYILTGCGACKQQKELFGSFFDKLNVVDCAKEQTRCNEAGISRVPTWIINGQKIIGVKSIEELKELTGCQK